MRLPISRTPGKGAMLSGCGILLSHCFVDVDKARELVTVHFGWGFHAEFALSDVATAARTADVRMTTGAHGWRGRWLVNGASGPIVTITLRGPVRAAVMGLPIRLRELSVSVEQPDQLIAALTAA
jgi:hypothetical protein